MNTADNTTSRDDAQLRVLKALHKYGALRARDLAALLWMKGRGRPSGEPVFEPMVVEPAALRACQRVLARLRRGPRPRIGCRLAPDGSNVYGVLEEGARLLRAEGIPAKSAKGPLRKISLSHWHHRRVAAELAIIGARQGFKVTTEHEILNRRFWAGEHGLAGKLPDAIFREGKNTFALEHERSRRSKNSQAELVRWLVKIFVGCSEHTPPRLPGDHLLRKVIFFCRAEFAARLMSDLKAAGWAESHIKSRLRIKLCDYTSGDPKFILKKPSQ